MRRLNNRGVTLVELLIGMAILSVVGLMITSLFGFASRMYHSTIVYADVQTESQTVARRLERSIMGAQAIYMEEGNTGTYLFMGERIEQSDSMAYKGEIFWWNKETGCLYQNSSFEAEETDMNGSLSADNVKTALESGAGGGKEFLISDKLIKLDFSIIPDLEGMEPLETGSSFYRVDGGVVIHYELTFQYLDSQEYEIDSSAAARNRVGILWWKEMGDPEEQENPEGN